MLLQAEHITKHIGTQLVLDDVSFTLRPSEVVGLLGPNGAGKSTLMKIFAGIWDADKRSDTVIQVPKRIGYLPEQNPLYDEMYVREYLRFFMLLRHQNATKEAVEELIQLVGLTPEANKRIGALSKGYRQRIGIAQAMIGDSELMILDEPTTGLDPNQLQDIRALIRQLGEKRVVILSTHVLQEVREMCSRVLIIHQGRIRTDVQMNDIASTEELETIFYNATHYV